MCKKTIVVSPHKDDEKEAWFLHRRVFVDDDGWHEELDPKYVDDFVKHEGVEYGHSIGVPGYKDGKKEIYDEMAGAKAAFARGTHTKTCKARTHA